MDSRNLEPGCDLLRSHATLTSQVKQIRELFRTRRTVALTISCSPALRNVFHSV